MKSVFRKFFISLSVYSLVLILAGFIAFSHLLPGYTPAIVPFVLICLMYYVITLIVHYILIKSKEKKARSFISDFIATTFIKLLAYLLILVICILLNRENAMVFGITFLILYLFYTVFETIAIIKFFKKV